MPSAAPAAAPESALDKPENVKKIADWPWTVDVVELKYVKPDPAYQRKLTSFVNKIVNNFNPALVGALCLSKRSDTNYAVMDGQTRAAALEELGRDEWIATVFHDLTVEQEAELFALFQTERRAMTSGDRFRAQVTAGKDHAVEITRIAESVGFTIAQTTAISPNEIRAVAALEYVYHGQRGGKSEGTMERKFPDLLKATLEVIRQAWPDLPDTAKHTDTIKGMGQFLYEHWDEGIDRDKLIRVLKRTNPAALAVRADQWRDLHKMTGKSPKNLAAVVALDYFEYGRRKSAA